MYITGKITLDVESLDVLIKDKSGLINKEASFIEKKDSQLSIEDILGSGRKAVNLFTRKIANIIRLEYTDRGPRFAVLGTFPEPANTTLEWPVITSEAEEFDMTGIDIDRLRQELELEGEEEEEEVS